MNDKKVTIQEVMNGQFFTREWFHNQRGIISLVIVLILVYIYAGYAAQRQHFKMTMLEKDLQAAEYEQLTIHANLTEVTRQSSIVKELQSKGSTIKENNTPVIKLK